jgi:hypothetical protein
VKNQVFNDNSNVLASGSTQIFDIQQKFGSPCMEIEGAIRYLMNFVNTSNEILFCFALKNPEDVEKGFLDKVKDILSNVSFLAK